MMVCKWYYNLRLLQHNLFNCYNFLNISVLPLTKEIIAPNILNFQPSGIEKFTTKVHLFFYRPQSGLSYSNMLINCNLNFNDKYDKNFWWFSIVKIFKMKNAHVLNIKKIIDFILLLLVLYMQLSKQNQIKTNQNY